MTGLGIEWSLLKRMNWVMVVAIALLIVIGVLFIHSACSVRKNDPQSLDQKQIGWAMVGLVGYLAAAMLDYRKLRDGAWWFYGIGLLLLITVLLVGTRIYGAKRWLMFFGIGVQPSEIVKLAVVILMACLLSPPADKFERIPSLGWLFLVAVIPMALIAKEPDLGTAMIFVPTVLALVYVGGAPARPLLILILAGVASLLLLAGTIVLSEKLGLGLPEQEKMFRVLGLSKQYQRDRIAVFLLPNKDPLGAGWNRRQSEIAVGSGGLTGKGYLHGDQNLLGFLPKTVAPTDFIFAVIAEETGFVGSVTVLGLYAVLMVCGIYTAMQARDKLGRVLCMGMVAMMFSHVFVNVAMTVGLMPITGLPLPLISYGGTFMVSTMFALGLIQSVYIRRQGV